MADEARMDALRGQFKAFDKAGDGRLSFEEFFALLKSGKPTFEEEQAQVLFRSCDEDMSGHLEFDEFVAFIYGGESTAVSMDRVFKLEKSGEEEECKQALMHKPGEIRAAASKAVKKRGENWGSLTWKERLEEVRELEQEEREHSEARTAGAPHLNPSSSLKGVAKRKAGRKDDTKATVSPKSIKKAVEGIESTEVRRTKAKEPSTSSLNSAMPKGLAVGKFAIADMSQEAIVNYSLQDDDLAFAGNNADVKAELREFRTHLKSAGSPLDMLDITKFIAKGTAGWVFLCANKETGKKCAMKLIRMTQARSGIKEWYCSKVLKPLVEAADADPEVESASVVFTEEVVRVVKRSDAPPVIKEQLENAGPVEYYMAMCQELMPWGTLEDLAKEGELSPEIMFKGLEDVARTLAVMHENNLQHRDVKPENIMLQMDEDETVVAAKLCDFGSAMIGNEADSRMDDIRRFGVTLFSVATGEGWTKNRLIREKHENLVSRLKEAVEGSEDPTMKMLPEILEKILSGTMQMKEVQTVMEELADNYED